MPVSYPFGFGLSYTTFLYDNAIIRQKDDAFEVSVTVKNVGEHDGKEVAQLYVAAPDSKAQTTVVNDVLKPQVQLNLLRR